jgi:hypothetical protein
MATPENFVEYLPWIVAVVVISVCVVGWLIASRDLDNRK